MGVHAVGHVRELLRVAEEDDVLRRSANGYGISERELTGLVDEQIVEALFGQTRKEEGRARQVLGARRQTRVEILVGLNESAGKDRIGTIRTRLLEPCECKTLLQSYAFQLLEQVVNR